MDLVSEISYCNKTCNAKSDNTIENNVFRQEIMAYHNQLVYHENNLPIPKNTDMLILGNPVRDTLKRPSKISSNISSQIINDENQLMAITEINPVLPLNYQQQTNRRSISPEHVMKNNIETQSNNRDHHQDMVTKTVSPISPLSYLQRSKQTIIDHEQPSCSRNPRKTLVDSNSNDSITKCRLAQRPRETVEECKVAEKTTYCRPAIDNKQYVHETIQKHARLQILVKKLALIREKEKQRIAWNNYINSLRNRHVLHKRSDSSTIPDSVPEYTNLSNSEIVENYITTRPACPKSHQSRYKLEDHYSTSKYVHKNVQYHLAPRLSPTFNSNEPNYTTNSQEHSMMLNFEIPPYDFPTQILPDHDYPYHTIPRYYYPTTPPTRAQIFLDDHQSRRNQIHRRPPLEFIDVRKSDVRNISVQTNTSTESAYSEKEICPNKSVQDEHKQDESSAEIIKKKLVSEVELKHSQLSTIDRKLDDLIYSINNFIHEIKSQKHLINMKNKREAINQTKSSSYLVECNLERGEIKRRSMQDRAISNISLCNENPQVTIYRILTEEMNKSHEVKRDIENKPNNSSSSLHITFDIPTKDTTVEIEDSFKVDPRSVCVKENSEHKRMTIAVNTDPLGLLGLFRVSAEAVKQLLSFVPSIDYYSYLSMLPLPAAKHTCQYVCNICGAAFDRPSCLSDHIQRHSLGRTR